MCGIVGYVGRRDAAQLIVEGLRRLEYRGYDSFGVATSSNALQIFKKTGKISENENPATDLEGTVGIGHTRWATHGMPSDINAHPLTDCARRIAIVHNGIIENFVELKRSLENKGHTFGSETDSEVIAHLVEDYFQGDLLEAVQHAVARLDGSFAILAITEGERDIVAARRSSPLVVGIGDGEMFAASDMTPLLEHTERMVLLEDGDIARLTARGVEVFADGRLVKRPIELINWRVEDAKLGGFDHYMLKEIYEQPQVFFETYRASPEAAVVELVERAEEITVVACGSSYHTGMIFKYLAESYCGKPVRVEQASEFKYFPPPLRGLVIAVSQSGETADTLAALKQAKSYNCSTLAITNVQGSTITRVADATFLMRAGPEISVAATKSFIAQLASFMHLLDRICTEPLDDLLSHAHLAIGEMLLKDYTDAVNLCVPAKNIFFVGRGPFYPVALEGALKMKEITYIHAEGYAAGELKHGPFALLSPETPIVAICTPGTSYQVMFSNIKEMKARGPPVIGIGIEGDTELAEIVDVFLPLPDTPDVVQILSGTVALQLLAYHTAVALERDIDKPRNLAKSVTVE